MKKGYNYNQYPNENFSEWNYVWYLGVVGRKYDPQFKARWNVDNYEHNIRKGVILVPEKEDIPNMVNIVASYHLQLLQELNVANKTTKAPIIIDYTSASGGKQFTYDQLYAYIGNIKDHWQAFLHGKKPLLRVSASTWAKWLTDSPVETGYMLQVIEPLVVQWTSSAQPKVIYNFGMPKWWEYSTGNYAYMGKVAHDATGAWSESPHDAVIEPIEDPIEDPIDEPIDEPIDDGSGTDEDTMGAGEQDSEWATLFNIGKKLRIQFKTS